MNWSWRGNPVPVFGDALLSLLLLKFTVDVMIPKLPGAVKFVGVAPGVYVRERVPGSPSWVWLKMLKACTANCMATCSVSLVSLVRARSACHDEKARATPFGALPK